MKLSLKTWSAVFVIAVLAAGCGDKKEVPPLNDPEAIKKEQEKFDKMTQETGEQRPKPGK